jgi:hypothetical protein
MVKDGIEKKIRGDMGSRFPDVRIPDFIQEGSVAAAFAYLRASLNFGFPYYDKPQLAFCDASGKVTAVRCFGLQKEEEWGAEDTRKQIRVLFARTADDGPMGSVSEFALDLDRESKPNQLIVAKIPRGKTLREMIAGIQKRETQFESRKGSGRFGDADYLAVPEMSWRIEHNFKELEGPSRTLTGGALTGMYIDPAYQILEFKLNKGGAQLESQAGMAMKGLPTLYLLNRPFLLYMQKRGAGQPYFAM